MALTDLGCQVIVVASNGNRESGLKFRKMVDLLFPLLLDGERQFYRRLGLKRSITAVWSVMTLKAYAEEKVAEVPPTLALPGDDLHVLGGDFIADSSGKIVFTYPSKTSSDRPSIARLLDELRSL